jgi:uncharacterized protein (TIGR00730 family)
MKRIAVYCGSSTGNDLRFMTLARSFGNALAAANLGLVYGGGQFGLMGALADGALSSGGEAIGIIPDFLQAKEIARPDPRVDLRVVSSMVERKALYETLADGFVALPGGYGTLDELFEVVVRAQLGLVRGPIVLLNDGGYYDGLLAHIDGAVACGFIAAQNQTIIRAEHTVEATIALFTGITKYLDAVGEK